MHASRRVQVDTSDQHDMHAPGSPASSGGGPSGGGGSYDYRGWQGQGMSMGSGSGTPRDGASPSESPRAQLWHHSAAPPAMAPLPPQQYGIFQQQQGGGMGPLDGDVMLGGAMGGMGGGIGGTRAEHMQMQQLGGQHGASPMRGSAFMSGCGNGVF